MKDYLHDVFIPSLFSRLEKEAMASNHCCGLCKKWDEYEDHPGYGDCKLGIRDGLGFDCIIGKTCVMFKPAFELEVGLHVHDKRLPQPIKVVEQMVEYICSTDDKCGCCDAYEQAERIVRCKNCKHWDTSHREPWDKCSEKRACMKLSFVHSDYPALSNFRYTEPDGFCAWGERRE